MLALMMVLVVLIAHKEADMAKSRPPEIRGPWRNYWFFWIVVREMYILSNNN
jgi:hypothetical protein